MNAKQGGVALGGDEIEARLRVAVPLIREAGAVAMGFFRDAALCVERKGVQDPVTVADRTVESLLAERLGAAFPGDGFLGEEGMAGGKAHSADAPLWIVDPIDGTDNFVRGLPLWCVSVALLVGGEVVLGLIYNPAGEELYVARAGGGATLNGAPIRVSGIDSPNQARITLGYHRRCPPANHAKAIERLLTNDSEYSRLGSGAIAMASVAAGRFEGYWIPHIKAWDIAAGICLVREAGGWVSDFFGSDGLANGNPILACTPGMRTFLLQQLGQLSDPPL